MSGTADWQREMKVAQLKKYLAWLKYYETWLLIDYEEKMMGILLA